MSLVRHLAAPVFIAAALLVGAGAFAQDTGSTTPAQPDRTRGPGYGGPGFGMMGPGYGGGPGYGYGMMGPGYGDRGYGMGYGRGYGPYDRRDRDRDFGERDRRDGPARYGMMRQGDTSAYLEGRIAFVAAELHLTDTQKPAWDKFAEALRANGKRQDALRGAMRNIMFGNRATDLSGRLDQEEQFLSTHLDSVRALKTALAPLVAALDDRQRQTLTELSPIGMGGMMGWGPMAGRFGG